MLGGYTEVVAYGKVAASMNSPKAKKAAGTQEETALSSSASTLSMMTNEQDLNKVASTKLMDTSPIHSSKQGVKDFILLAECSELCGPVPVLTVPLEVGEFVDVSALVVQLMSTDLQGVGRTIIYPSDDLQLLTLDLIPGWHALTNYFTVVDLHARGFVRPASIAYLTQDKQKLITVNASLRESLKLAAHTIKCSAMKSFMTDWNQMQGADEGEIPKSGKRNSVSLSSSTKELGHILNVIATCLTENVELGTGIDHMLKLVHHVTTLTKRDTHLLLKVKNSPTPTKSVSYQNASSSLRPLIELCTGGFLLGLHHLYKIQQYYSKPQESILAYPEDSTCKGILHFGVCPKPLNSSKANSTSSQVPNGPTFLNASKNFLEGPRPVVNSFKSVLARDLDDGFINILHSLCSSENLREILSHLNVLQDEDQEAYVLPNRAVENYDCLSATKCDKDPGPADKPICSRHTLQLGKIWCVEERLKQIDVDTVLCKVSKMKNPSQLFFSLLVGRLFVITGPPQMKKDVEALVNFLGLFVPHRKWKGTWKRSWCMSFLESSEMKSTMILGIGLVGKKTIENMMPPCYLRHASVLDLKKNIFKGPKYEGVLLREFDRKLTSVEGMELLLPLIISILLDIERKAFLLWLSSQTSSKNASAKGNPASKYLASQGYSHSDMTILKRLAELLNEEEET